MTDLMVLADALRQSLGDYAGVGVTDPRKSAPPLLPQEEAATTRMRAIRRREFAAGRAAVRVAMADLGLPAAAVPMGSDRAPCWPAGLCGSISHCTCAAVAIVARHTEATGLGIDIEEDTDLPPDLWDVVLTAGEKTWLRKQPLSAQGRRAKALFCAKEAIHKLHYPLTGRMLEFKDVTVRLDTWSFRFQLPFQVPGLPDEITGQILRVEGFIIAVLTGPTPVSSDT